MFLLQILNFVISVFQSSYISIFNPIHHLKSIIKLLKSLSLGRRERTKYFFLYQSQSFISLIFDLPFLLLNLSNFAGQSSDLFIEISYFLCISCIRICQLSNSLSILLFNLFYFLLCFCYLLLSFL